MGKKGGNSWFSAVKKAFRSPTKDKDKITRRTSRRRDEHDEEEKKREKRRWIFRKPSNQETVVVTIQQPRPESQPQPQPQTQREAETIKTSATAAQTSPTAAIHVSAAVNAKQRQAVAVAVTTAAAVEAAVVTAQAAAEVVHLTTATRPTSNANFIRQHYAAIVIQTAFRGYLARRALAALRGLVKLQALVRGCNVRKQVHMTLKCMQALVRVQAQVRDRRMRLSQDGSRNSTISDLDRNSINSRDGSSVGGGDWDDRPHTLEEIQAMLENRKEAAAAAALSLKREKALSHAFSHQIWRCEDDPSEEEFEEKPKWSDHVQWTVMKPWEDRRRTSTDQKEQQQQQSVNIKTVEIDTYRPYTYSSTPTIRRSQQQSYSHYAIGSPLQREGVQHQSLSLNHSPVPVTPSPYKTRPLQVRSSSPRQYLREEERYNYRRSHTNTQTPPSYSASAYYYNEGDDTDGKLIPSYMAATESAKARSQSVPRQRAPLTPEREGGHRGGGLGSAKKRLSFPDVPNQDPYNLYGGGGGDGVGDGRKGGVVKHERHSRKSPSFKRWSGNGNRQGGYYVVGGSEIEQQSNLSSCCTDGEISPSYTSYLRTRRWVR